MHSDTNYRLIVRVPRIVFVLLAIGGLIRIIQAIEAKRNLPEIRQPLSYKDVAVVTGGSQGLGAEIVRSLVRRYNVKKVYVLDIVPIKSTSKVAFKKCDVADKKQLEHTLRGIVDECAQAGDFVSVFVNNAGIRHSSSLIDTADEDIEKLFNINVMAYIWGAKFLINNHLQTVLSADPDARLSVVAVSSVLGYLAPKNLAIYSATKAALTQLHEGLTVEIKHKEEIRPLLVLPGQLSEGMFSDVKPTRKFFAPLLSTGKVADDIVDRISTEQTGTLTMPLYGKFLPVVKILPSVVVDWCRNFSQMDQKISS